jgi:hypothetical protein
MVKKLKGVFGVFSAGALLASIGLLANAKTPQKALPNKTLNAQNQALSLSSVDNADIECSLEKNKTSGDYMFVSCAGLF